MWLTGLAANGQAKRGWDWLAVRSPFFAGRLVVSGGRLPFASALGGFFGMSCFCFGDRAVAACKLLAAGARGQSRGARQGKAHRLLDLIQDNTLIYRTPAVIDMLLDDRQNPIFDTKPCIEIMIYQTHHNA